MKQSCLSQSTHFQYAPCWLDARFKLSWGQRRFVYPRLSFTQSDSCHGTHFWVSGRVHGVELVVQRPDSIPFELQVQVAVHILQEVLQPVGRRWLLRQPIDVTGIVLHHPPQLELLVFAEVQLFRTQVVDLVLDQPLLESDVVVVDRDELLFVVRRAVTTGMSFFKSS